MFDIYEDFIDFNVNSDSNLVIAMAQLPVCWKKDGNFVRHKDPGKQWKLIEQTLNTIKESNFQGRRVDVAVFPEWSVPHECVDKLKECVKKFNSDFILLAGFDYISLERFVELLEGSDNRKKEEQVRPIIESTDYTHIKKDKPVNFCSIIVKSGDEVKQYFQSKLFPAGCEQTGSRNSEILHGGCLSCFKVNARENNGTPGLQKFSFFPLICFDQLYEKTEAGFSVIESLIEYSKKHGAPDIVFILQYNPRMNHPSIDEALYEYYLCLPTRALRACTYTLFVNVSDGSTNPNKNDSPVHGSLLVFNKKAIFNDTSEHRLTKMGRGNLHKMEFVNTSDRLYFLECALLSNYKEVVRASRNPIEIMQICERKDTKWNYVLPKEVIYDKVNSNSLYPMIDMYCSDEFIGYFEDGALGNKVVIDELRKNELLGIFQRIYEYTQKEEIPTQLIESLEQLVKRLDQLEKVKDKKLTETEDENVKDKLYTVGTYLQQSKKIIKSITKKW
ncbi:MAG: hypothetical protein AEth_01920 [Candidatus Argoarchaeum ethanivorans]|uniref:Uncharacterized protein n=1 Tax=Candidatus Argoarchaeum ethanivorans TaxID=2608793 RepID=A0A8B3S108_9EURY|nr:MAG: hypothetical protein AEth_01920 [Candidatus Argoarchaeum ethanivorans]